MDLEEKQPRSIAELIRILEALVFVADEPISAKDLANVVEEDADFVQSAVEELAQEYESREGGLQLREIARLDYVVWSSHTFKESVEEMCVLPNGTEIVTITKNILAVISFATGETLRTLVCHTDKVRTALITSDVSKIIMGYYDNTVRVNHLYIVAQKRIIAVSAGLTFGSAKISHETLYQLDVGLKRLMFNFFY